MVLRYAFNSGIAISEELSRLLFVWLIFPGAVLASAQRIHIGFDTLQRHAGPHRGGFRTHRKQNHYLSKGARSIMTVAVFLVSLLGLIALGVPIAFALMFSGIALTLLTGQFDTQIGGAEHRGRSRQAHA